MPVPKVPVIPQLGVARTSVPAAFSATSVGTYPAMCAELCGLGHTTMTTTVVISDQATFDAWFAHELSPEP
jgi:heme/copper-type cytochrome/quinol oxidase subunit 2